MNGKPYVLHVDDDEDYRDILRFGLETLTYTGKIRSVEDGVEALAYLRKEDGYSDAPTPGVILLDLKMPRMNGLAVLEQIRADPSLCEIPVLVLTNSVLTSDRERAASLGARQYLTKLESLETLHATIERVTTRPEENS